MGLRTGQAVADGGLTPGWPSTPARIGAAAHGGQILVSQAAQTLLEDEEEDLRLPTGPGEQRLKDWSRPALPGHGECASFPPLRHKAELAESQRRRFVSPWRRRRWWAAALALAALVAATAFWRRRTPAAAGEIHPNHVGIIDPATNEIVGEG